MRFGYLLVFLFFIVLFDSCLSIRLNNWQIGAKKKHDLMKSKIKFVHYAIIKENKFKVVKLAAKNLEYEPYRDWSAKAMWNGNDYNSTGWSLLEIETNEKAKDFDQAFSAGLLEGSTTRDLIHLHMLNNVGDFCEQNSTTCSKLIEFLEKNFKWIRNQVEEHPEDPYWHHVRPNKRKTFCILPENFNHISLSDFKKV